MMKLGPNPLSLSLALGILAMCQSCTVGVDYKNPDLQLPDAWAVSVAGQAATSKNPLERWWKGFNDPVLNELIDRTKAANPDLRAASMRIAEARALRGAARSELFPTVNATGDFSRNRASESLFVPPPENPSNLYTSGFDAGWEIDVFGGIRRNIESADATIEASVESQNGSIFGFKLYGSA